MRIIRKAGVAAGDVIGAGNLLTTGAIPYVSAPGTLNQDQTAGGQLLWDSTNHRLGIGNAAPTEKLDVTGNGKISGTLSVGGVASVNGIQFPGSGTYTVASSLGGQLNFTASSANLQLTGGRVVMVTAIEATLNNSLVFGNVGAGPVLKQGANGRVGTFVANGVTPVTVSNTSVAVTDAIVISLNTVGGTISIHPVILTITAGVGFTVSSAAADTSTYNYAIIRNAA